MGLMREGSCVWNPPSTRPSGGRTRPTETQRVSPFGGRAWTLSSRSIAGFTYDAIKRRFIDQLRFIEEQNYRAHLATVPSIIP